MLRELGKIKFLVEWIRPHEQVAFVHADELGKHRKTIL